jgi:hypothetical protein
LKFKLWKNVDLSSCISNFNYILCLVSDSHAFENTQFWISFTWDEFLTAIMSHKSFVISFLVLLLSSLPVWSYHY